MRPHTNLGKMKQETETFSRARMVEKHEVLTLLPLGFLDFLAQRNLFQYF